MTVSEVKYNQQTNITRNPVPVTPIVLYFIWAFKIILFELLCRFLCKRLL